MRVLGALAASAAMVAAGAVTGAAPAPPVPAVERRLPSAASGLAALPVAAVLPVAGVLSDARELPTAAPFVGAHVAAGVADAAKAKPRPKAKPKAKPRTTKPAAKPASRPTTTLPDDGAPLGGGTAIGDFIRQSGTRGASGAGATSSTPAGAVTPLDWRGCDAGLECTTLRAPLDYDNPNGPSIGVFVARRRAGDPSRRLGVLYVNPGGPGAPAYELLRDAIDQVLTAEELARFDVIAMDPRGTQRSRPLTCEDADVDLVEDPSPEQLYTAIGEACRQTDGPALAFLDTVGAARDMDRLREALGEKTISYAGFSYGGYLGAVYASLFPGSLRAVILDSGVDPDVFGSRYLLEKMRSWERALNAFLTSCADGSLPACAFNDGTDLRARYNAIIAKLGEPDPASPTTNSARYQFESRVLALLAEPVAWPYLANGLALAATLTRPADIVRAIAVPRRSSGGGSDGGSDEAAIRAEFASFAVFCRDGILPVTAADVDAVRAGASAASPSFAAIRAGSASLSICTHWGVAPRPRPQLRALGSPPVLVLGSTLDLFAPVEWSQGLAQKMGAAIVIRSGPGHVAMGRSECIDQVAQSFLVDLGVPPAGTACDVGAPVTRTTVPPPATPSSPSPTPTPSVPSFPIPGFPSLPGVPLP